MASGASPNSSRSPSPLEMRRTMSSQSGLHRQQSQSQSVSFTVQNAGSLGASRPNSPSTTRQRSGSRRLNDILQIATQRANSMSLQGTTVMPSDLQPYPPTGTDDPDERTHIVGGRSPIDYQGTRVSSMASLRNRQPSSRPETNPGNGAATPHEEKKHWLSHYWDGVWSIELENKGSVARDHLAVERTFLAWLRTSLSFASIGVAVTQLFRLNASLVDEETQHRLRRLGAPLGTAFIGISILVLLLGYHRFYQPQQWLLKGKFPASRGAIILISFLSFALMLASLLIVVILQPTNEQ
ncbi:hypothetical protein GGR50DRAFT_644561 [Xylaria sp. CBS 124048]|nr:hypothetical protein GGR50DRAFT_644561 [Xylaria sp. CBS 124048]